MKEYITLVICTSALIALGTVLSYKEGDMAVKCAFSVILVCSVLLPLAPAAEKLFNDGLPSFSSPSFSDTEYIEITEDAFAEGIKNAITDRFDLDDENINVKLGGFDFSEMRCDKITVVLSGKDVTADFMAIKGYLAKNFEGCDVRIEVG